MVVHSKCWFMVDFGVRCRCYVGVWLKTVVAMKDDEYCVGR